MYTLSGNARLHRYNLPLSTLWDSGKTPSRLNLLRIPGVPKAGGSIESTGARLLFAHLAIGVIIRGEPSSQSATSIRSTTDGRFFTLVSTLFSVNLYSDSSCRRNTSSALSRNTIVLTPWLDNCRAQLIPAAPERWGPHNTTTVGHWWALFGFSRWLPPNSCRVSSAPARPRSSTFCKKSKYLIITKWKRTQLCECNISHIQKSWFLISFYQTIFVFTWIDWVLQLNLCYLYIFFFNISYTRLNNCKYKPCVPKLFPTDLLHLLIVDEDREWR